MSRSIRQAVFVDGYGSPGKKIWKRFAARAVRQFKGEIPDGAHYRKLYDQWNICDFRIDVRWGPRSWWHDHYRVKRIHDRWYQNK